MIRSLLKLMLIVFYCFALYMVVVIVAAWIGPGYDIIGHANSVGPRAKQIHAILLLPYTNSVVSRYTMLCSGESTTSTDFFCQADREDLLMGIQMDMFGGKYGTVELTPEENIWGVTLGLDERSSPNTPFMFTRNVRFHQLEASANGPFALDDMDGLSKGVQPFSNKLCVIITWGGEMKILRKKEAKQESFNPDGATNTVLLP